MIEIRAEVRDREGHHEIALETNGRSHRLAIDPRPAGRGSSVNGGELLFLAIATCFCNDLYREAARIGLAVEAVRVQVSGAFGEAPGSMAERIVYDVTVEAAAGEPEIDALVRHTDGVAEVHNTLRRGTPVTLGRVTAVDRR